MHLLFKLWSITNIFLICSANLLISSKHIYKCISKRLNSKDMMCVCNGTFCGEMETVSITSQNDFVSYTSTEDGDRLKIDLGKLLLKESSNFPDKVTVKMQERQSILGFGAAFTDAAGINIKKLTVSAQQKLLKAYFSKLGSNYNMGRVPIGSTDFSTRFYSYDDVNGDVSLQHFGLVQDDYLYKIPFLKIAKSLNGNLRLLATAWSSPLWMRDNNTNFILENLYDTWSKYHLKFLQAYSSNGINFWALSSGNEPFLRVFTYMPAFLAWSQENLATWIENNLGPDMKNQFPEIKIITVDDQIFNFPNSVNEMFNAHERANKYVSGFGLHWYFNNLTSPQSYTDHIFATHLKYPSKFILSTEACNIPPVMLGKWNFAELYALDIINNMNNYVTGWIDWNLALDLRGGPNYINIFLNSAIMIDAESDEFYLQPSYFALAHFSKFVPRRSKNLAVTNDHRWDDLHVAAFLAPEKEHEIVVVLNRAEENRIIKLVSERKGSEITKKIPPKSITTIIYKVT